RPSDQPPLQTFRRRLPMAHPATLRLDLLQSAGKLSPAARQAADGLVQSLQHQLSDPMESPDAIRLVTHLALACQRVVDKTAAPPPSPAVLTEIAPYLEERALAQQLLDQAGAILGAPFPEAEVAYLTMHLVVARTEESR
ncbi:MAG: PRD domain-containing protein, partial [Pseudarthrobacter sp.]